MSTIDKLKQAQIQRREGTVPAGACPRSSTETHPHYSHSQTSPANRNWVIGLILFILIASNLMFTFKLSSMINDYKSKGDNSQEKLGLVVKIVTDNTNNINSISSGLSQLEKQINSQAVTIEKLIKANNTMFGRLKSLESKLDQILKQTK